MPIYKTKEGEFLIIDKRLFAKTIFKSVYFDFYKILKNSRGYNFNSYSSQINSKVFESLCFHSVMNKLTDSKKYHKSYGHTRDNAPDFYIRKNNKIYLFEFKAYLFPDKLSKERNHEEFLNFLRTRFIKSDAGKNKGTLQLLKLVKLIKERNFLYDDKLNRDLQNKRLKVYPIIVYTEFEFSLPGISEYLTHEVKEEIIKVEDEITECMPFVFINLAILFDSFIRNLTFDQIGEFVDRYHLIMKKRKKKVTKDFNDFASAMASFEEIYHSIFLKEEKLRKKNIRERNFREVIKLTEHDFNEKIGSK